MAGTSVSPAAEQALTPLTSVTVVCRLHPRVCGISDIVASIDSFVGADAKWTVSTACSADLPGELRLLRRLAVHEDPDMDSFLKRKYFSDALGSAIKRDKFEVVKWLVEEYLPRGRIRDELEHAARSGQLRAIRWLWEHHRARVVWTSVLMFFASSGGHVELAKWLHTEIGLGNLGASEKFKAHAIKNGNVALLEGAIELGARISAADIDEAAKLGHLPILEWIASMRHVRVSESLVASVVRAGHLEVLKWLARQPGAYLTVSGRDLQSGSAPLVSWVLENAGVEDKKSLARGIDVAAGCSDLAFIKLLHENSSGASCTTAAMDNAAKAGHLEILQWLHENRWEGCSTKAMDGAASGGHLRVLEWLYENRREGCTPRAMDRAAEHGHLEIVRWMHAHHLILCTTDAMDLAAGCGHLEMVEWLHNDGRMCTTDAMDNAAVNGHLDVVQWLHANRNEGCTTRAMDGAASSGRSEVLEWLYEHRPEGCTHRAMVGATARGHLQVVRWLFATGLAPVTWRTAMIQIDNDNLESIKWMLPLLPNALNARRTAHVWSLEMAQLLHSDGRFPLRSRDFHHAVAFGNWHLLQWFMQTYPDAMPTRRELELAEDAVEERDAIKRAERPRRSYMQDAIFGFEQLRGD